MCKHARLSLQTLIGHQNNVDNDLKVEKNLSGKFTENGESSKAATKCDNKSNFGQFKFLTSVDVYE